MGDVTDLRFEYMDTRSLTTIEEPNLKITFLRYGGTRLINKKEPPEGEQQRNSVNSIGHVLGQMKQFFAHRKYFSIQKSIFTTPKFQRNYNHAFRVDLFMYRFLLWFFFKISWLMDIPLAWSRERSYKRGLRSSGETYCWRFESNILAKFWIWLLERLNSKLEPCAEQIFPAVVSRSKFFLAAGFGRDDNLLATGCLDFPHPARWRRRLIFVKYLAAAWWRGEKLLAPTKRPVGRTEP